MEVDVDSLILRVDDCDDTCEEELDMFPVNMKIRVTWISSDARDGIDGVRHTCCQTKTSLLKEILSIYKCKNLNDN